MEAVIAPKQDVDVLGLVGKEFPSQFVVSLESDRFQNALEIFVSDECFQGARVVTQVHNIMLPGRISRAVFFHQALQKFAP